MDEYNIDWNGKNLFRVQYYGIDDTSDSSMGFLKTVYDQGTWLGWNLSDNLKEALNTAFNLWAEIIGPGANISQPAQVFVATNDEQNAFALSRSYKYGTEHYNPNLYHAIFQNAQEVTQFNNISEIPYIKNEDDVVLTDLENIGYGMIGIGQNMGVNENNGDYGWINTNYYAFPIAQAMKNLDLTPVMLHEIGHSLGIAAYCRGVEVEFNDDKVYCRKFIYNAPVQSRRN